MIVDEVTALRLYSHAMDSVPRQPGKESTYYEEVDTEIKDVPCIVRFGFSSERECAKNVTTRACVWIFAASGAEFFGAIYLPVDNGAHAPAILNSAIDRAIEQAILHPKFAA